VTVTNTLTKGVYDLLIKSNYKNCDPNTFNPFQVSVTGISGTWEIAWDTSTDPKDDPTNKVVAVPVGTSESRKLTLKPTTGTGKVTFKVSVVNTARKDILGSGDGIYDFGATGGGSSGGSTSSAGGNSGTDPVSKNRFRVDSFNTMSTKISGNVWNPSDLNQSFVVELMFFDPAIGKTIVLKQSAVFSRPTTGGTVPPENNRYFEIPLRDPSFKPKTLYEVDGVAVHSGGTFTILPRVRMVFEKTGP
jgi:hypothetical protein